MSRLKVFSTRYFFIVGGIGLLALFAFACGGREEATPTQVPAPAPAAPAAPAPAAPAPALTAPQPPAAVVAKPSGELIVGIPLLPPLVQLQSKDARGSVGGFGNDWNVYEGIVRAKWVLPPEVPPQDQYMPELAESWEIAPNLRKITFKIHKGVPWHRTFGNFGDVTAADIAWTYNDSFKEGATGNPGEQLPPGHKVGWDVLDEYTAVMNVAEGGMDPLWGVLHGGIGWGATYGMTSKKAYDQLGEEKFTTSPIGTGPFVVKSWTGNDEMVAEAQEGHWRITPRIKTLRIVEMPEQSTREAALLAGEVDITQISGKLLKRIVAATGGKVATTGVPTPNMFYMSGNYWAKECPLCSAAERDLVANPRPGYVEAREKKYPWVADPDNPEDMERARKVRWAMSMAIDRQKIGDTVLGGFGRPAYTFHNIFPGDEDWKDAWFVPHDPAKARQWLTEAGYPDGFALTIWSAPDLSAIWDPEIADAVAEMWRQELKLDVKVDHSPYAARRPETVNKRMNVPWLHGMGLFPGTAIAGFYCPTPGHLGGIELRKEICDIGYRNDTESTLKKRRENNIEVQNYLSHWQLQIAVATVGNFYLYMPQVKEWKPYMTGYFNNPESIVLQR